GISLDRATLLKKLPSLAHMAVSAAGQKRHFLRGLREDSPIKRLFLIERAACVVIPLGLDDVVFAITGQSITKSAHALEFGLQILRTLKDALRHAGRSASLDMRLESLSTPASFPMETTTGMRAAL